MCDYSLHHVATRPAKIEDRLVTTKFHNTITRGFASVSDPRVAVCLMPGTELAFDRDVECEAALAIFPTKKIGQRVARFRQVNTDQPTMHHDALEFPNGQVVLLTSLCDNQCATVLQMPAAPRGKTPGETERETRADERVSDAGAPALTGEPRIVRALTGCLGRPRRGSGCWLCGVGWARKEPPSLRDCRLARLS